MSGLFSSPKMPAATLPQTTTAPPSRSDADVQAGMAAQRQRTAGMRGRGATLLTGGDAPIGDQRKTLLGE